jgi:hypothetical protein
MWDGFFRLAGSFGAIPMDQVPEKGSEWVVMSHQQATFWRSQVEGLFDHFRPTTS